MKYYLSQNSDNGSELGLGLPQECDAGWLRSGHVGRYHTVSHSQRGEKSRRAKGRRDFCDRLMAFQGKRHAF